jgi:hypothetical protein
MIANEIRIGVEMVWYSSKLMFESAQELSDKSIR